MAEDSLTKSDLEHIAHLLAQQTQREFYLEITRVESTLSKQIKDIKSLLRDLHERLNKISLLANKEIPHQLSNIIEPMWSDNGK